MLYVAAYCRQGITHPNVVFFGFLFLYIPLKYFLVKSFSLDYSYYAAIVGNLNSSRVVEDAGFLLLIYVLGSVSVHAVCRIAHIRIVVREVHMRFDVSPIAIVVVLSILTVFVATNGLGRLNDGLSLRTYTQERGIGYLSTVLDLLIVIGLLQLIESRKHSRAILFFVFQAAYGILAGRTAVMVSLLIAALLYLNMVKRKVPYLWLIIGGLIVPPLAFIHGVIRVRGDFSEGFSLLEDIVSDQNLISRVLQELVGRIDQLEEFSVLAKAISEDKISTNLLWPLNLVIQFVPRAIWPDKPYFFNAEMMSIFYPEILQEGITFNFLGVGEMLYVFNFPGLFVAAMFTGYLLYVGDVYSKRSTNKLPVFLFFYAIPFSYLSLGFQIGWLNTYAPAMILINFLVFLFFAKVKRLVAS